MKILYALSDYQLAHLARTLPGPQAYLSPAYNAFTDEAAMTAMCLMDALCDFEHSAGHRRGLREAGGNPFASNPDADLGDLLCELRSEQGSFDLRQSVLDMVATVDAAWERLSADDATDGTVCFDFEFCPVAVRLRFQMGLTGDALEQALVERGRDMIEEADKAAEAHRAGLNRAAAITAAQNALSQAQASVEAAARHLQSLTAS